jgi:hypothetical protein
VKSFLVVGSDPVLAHFVQIDEHVSVEHLFAVAPVEALNERVLQFEMMTELFGSAARH